MVFACVFLFPTLCAGQEVNSYRAEVEVFGRDREGPIYQVGADIHFSFDTLQRDAEHMTDAAVRSLSRTWIGVRLEYGVDNFETRGYDISSGSFRLAGALGVSRALSLGLLWQNDTTKYTTTPTQFASVSDNIYGLFCELHPSQLIHLRETVAYGRRRRQATGLYERDDCRPFTHLRHEMNIIFGQNALSQSIVFEIARPDGSNEEWIDMHIVHCIEFCLSATISITPHVAFRRRVAGLFTREEVFAVGLRWYAFPNLSLNIAPAYVSGETSNHATSAASIGGSVRLRL